MPGSWRGGMSSGRAGANWTTTSTAIREGGGTVLTVSTIADGELLYRSGTTIDGTAVGSGLTNSGGSLKNNLITGVAGGQTIIGGTTNTEAVAVKPYTSSTKSLRFSEGFTGPIVANVSNTSTASLFVWADAALPTELAAVGSYSGSAQGAFTGLGSGFATTGMHVADGLVVAGQRSGGLSVAATHAAGAIRFYTGGTTDSNLRGTVSAAGLWDIGPEDAGTNTIIDTLTLRHRSSGTPVAGIGTALVFATEDAGGADQDIAKMRASLTTATAAAEVGTVRLAIVNAGTMPAAGSEQFGFTSTGRLGVGRPDPETDLEVYSTTSSLRIRVNANVSGNADAYLSLYCGSGGGSDAAVHYYGQSAGTEWTGGFSATNGRWILGTGSDSPTSATEMISFSQNDVASAAGATLDRVRIPTRTVTVTGSTNITSAGGFNYMSLVAPTYSAASALTISDSATLYISGGPTGGGVGPATLIRSYPLWIDSGTMRYDDNIALGGGAGATLGTIGGGGPGAAAQNEWLRINVGGNVRFIPLWA